MGFRSNSRIYAKGNVDAPGSVSFSAHNATTFAPLDKIKLINKLKNLVSLTPSLYGLSSEEIGISEKLAQNQEEKKKGGESNSVLYIKGIVRFVDDLSHRYDIEVTPNNFIIAPHINSLVLEENPKLR